MEYSYAAIDGEARVVLRQRGSRPELPHGFVRVQIVVAGICGGDVKNVVVGRPAPLGHEYLGTVMESRASSRKPGDRVVGLNSLACGNCDRCMEGWGRGCMHRWLLKQPTVATSVDVPAWATHLTTLAPDLGALVEPLAAAISNFDAIAAPGAPDPQRVLGRGPLSRIAREYAALSWVVDSPSAPCSWVYSESLLEEAIRSSRPRDTIALCFSPSSLALAEDVVRGVRDLLLALVIPVASPNSGFDRACAVLASSPERFRTVLGRGLTLDRIAELPQVIEENRKQGAKTLVVVTPPAPPWDGFASLRLEG